MMNEKLNVILRVLTMLLFVTTFGAAYSDVKPATISEPEFVEGVHYFNIFPEMQTNSTLGKVEVIELIWLSP